MATKGQNPFQKPGRILTVRTTFRKKDGLIWLPDKVELLINFQKIKR